MWSWSRILIALSIIFAGACEKSNEIMPRDGGAGGTQIIDPIGTSGMIIIGTGGTIGNTGGTSATGGTGVTGTGAIGGSGNVGTREAGIVEPFDSGLRNDSGGFVTGGTDVVLTGGTGSAGTGGIGITQTGGVGPAGSGGIDNGGNHYIRGPEPTVTSATANGPYNVQSYSSGFAVGPNFPAGTIWYPTDAQAPFAAIAIVPGFMSPRMTIEAWGGFLASHGIVAFTIDTNAVTDLPDQRSRALLNALESLKAENTRTGSPLVGMLDNDRQAVGGWSMGGGGTLITVNGNPNLKAGMAMCAWNPGALFIANRVPTLMFASLGDPLAGGQSQGFYTSIPEATPKMLFEWGSGDHFMANAPTGASGQVGRYGLSWLKVFLEGDERYRQFIEQPCDGCTDFRSNL